jgi:enamine deaminase RidA (YjgF/YER057c/UK114 family)
MVEHASGLHTGATLPRRKNGNVQGLLATDELTMDNIVSTTVFLEDMNQFTKMNDVHE